MLLWFSAFTFSAFTMLAHQDRTEIGAMGLLSQLPHISGLPSLCLLWVQSSHCGELQSPHSLQTPQLSTLSLGQSTLGDFSLCGLQPLAYPWKNSPWRSPRLSRLLHTSLLKDIICVSHVPWEWSSVTINSLHYHGTPMDDFSIHPLVSSGCQYQYDLLSSKSNHKQP